jgi:homoserine dehydrogenase
VPASFVPPPPLPYFLRFVVRDQPGILAAIAAALARREINVDALLQEPGYPKDGLPFVITVEPCDEASLLEALADLSAADWHAQPPFAMPMLLGSLS